MKKAIIFDMDGVLVNSEPVIEAAAIQGLEEYGISPKSDDFKPFVGAGEDAYIGGVARKYGLTYIPEMKVRVYEIYLEIVDKELEKFDGIVEALTQLKNKGYKLALASSADMIKIQANLRVAGIRRDLFEVILGGEDVSNKKPAPDIYQLAAKKLGLSCEDCVVIEDAINGVEAAIVASMTCVGIASSFSDKELKEAGAYQVCQETKEIVQHL